MLACRKESCLPVADILEEFVYKFSYGNDMLTMTSNKGVNIAVSLTQPSQVLHAFAL